MPNEEKEVEKTSVVDAVTVDNADDKPDFADDVEKWKHFSRVNEDRANDNYRQLLDVRKQLETSNDERDKARGELNDALLENAKLNAMLRHPQLTREVFDALFKGTDPDEVEAWADEAAKLIPMPGGVDDGDAKPEPGKKEPYQATDAMKHIMNMHEGDGTFKPGPRRGEAYERAMARQRERAASLQQHKNKN